MFFSRYAGRSGSRWSVGDSTERELSDLLQCVGRNLLSLRISINSLTHSTHFSLGGRNETRGNNIKYNGHSYKKDNIWKHCSCTELVHIMSTRI